MNEVMVLKSKSNYNVYKNVCWLMINSNSSILPIIISMHVMIVSINRHWNVLFRNYCLSSTSTAVLSFKSQPSSHIPSINPQTMKSN
jgi:hypothetical protein